jgi:hypothetical protein
MPPPQCHAPQGGFSWGHHTPLYVQPHPNGPQPKCRYGNACRREGCVFRHPSHSEAADSAQSSTKVCLAFLSGTCHFGAACMYRHPRSRDENNRTRALLATIPCKYGENCSNEYCLFKHPNAD